MRVLITGAGGFVGAALIRHLRACLPGCAIVGTTHSAPQTSLDPLTEYVRCDIVARGGRDIAALVERERPDHVYHLAGLASGAASDRETVLRVNSDGTRFVVDAVQKFVPQARVLFASTGYVYGACDMARPARETDPLPPLGVSGAYGDSKRAAEEWLMTQDQPVIVARAFNHTGPQQTQAFAVPAFAAQIIQIERGAQTELRVGNLEASRDFLDVRDVVHAYAALMQAGQPGIVNVCSGEAVRMQDILDMLRAQSPVTIPVIPDPARMRPADIPVSVGDPARLYSLIGPHARIPLAQTLRETLDWWRARSPRVGERE